MHAFILRNKLHLSVRDKKDLMLGMSVNIAQIIEDLADRLSSSLTETDRKIRYREK
jgi:hypothetical protein